MKIIGPVDRVIILWASVSRALLAGGSGSKPIVPTLMTSHFSRIITPIPEGLFHKTRGTMIITRKKKRLVFIFFFKICKT